MATPLKALSTIDELDALLASSAARPILIFKHSATCGTSAMAAEEIDALVTGPLLDADVYLLRIQAARAVSDEIERRLRVRHESPQVLLLQHGQVVWSASHFRVTAAAVLAAVEATAVHH